MVVEIWLMYFPFAKDDYVSEIPVMSCIPVQDIS